MKTQTNDAIENFVRGPLGCNCPSEVFEIIDVTDDPIDFQNLPAARLIKIGGILLVLIIQVDDWEPVQFKLESIFRQGITLRDKTGFNRFRLVVATPDSHSAKKALNKHFGKFLAMDKKIHLHIVRPEQLPDYSCLS